MEKKISNDKFQSDMEHLTYFVNYDVPDTSDDDNHMEQVQGISEIPDLYDVLGFTSVETAKDTDNQCISASVEILDNKGDAIMARVQKTA